MVTLIGMGSGTPELLTAQGLAALQSADLIIGAKRLLEHLPIQPVKVPGSRAALIHAAAQLFCPQEADARLVEQQLRRRETLGDTYIKSLYALLLHCRTSAE